MSPKLPSPTTIGTVLAFVGALFIGYVGVSYLLAPQSMAPNFGLPSWPHGEGAGFLAVKGARDLASGLVILTATAFGVHGATAATVILAGGLVLSGSRTGSPRPVA